MLNLHSVDKGFFMPSGIFSRLSNLRRLVVTALTHGPKTLQPFQYQMVLITLTYRDVEGWEPNHVKDYLRKLRAFVSAHSDGMRMPYLWVLELQQRGAPHYHICCWIPDGVRFPFPDEEYFSGKSRKLYPAMWPHGSSNVTFGIRNPAGYLSKYVSKIRSKAGGAVEYPAGARIYGLGGFDGASSYRAWARAPRWARMMSPPGQYFAKKRRVAFRPWEYRADVRYVYECYDVSNDFPKGCALPYSAIRKMRKRPIFNVGLWGWTFLGAHEYVGAGSITIPAEAKYRYYVYQDRLRGLFAFLLGNPRNETPRFVSGIDQPAVQRHAGSSWS